MVKVTSLFGHTYFYRCTPSGKIQRSDDGVRWRVAKNWSGKRVVMSNTTVKEVEEKIARKLDDPDRTLFVQVI